MYAAICSTGGLSETHSVGDEAKRWKDEYRELLRETEQQASDAKSVQQHFQQLLRVILGSCMGLSAATDEEIEVLKIRVDRAESAADLAALHGAMSDLGRALGAQQRANNTAVVSIASQLVRARDQFIASLQREPLLASALAEMTHDAEATDEDVFKDFEDIATRVIQTCVELANKKNDAERFLEEVRSTLRSFEQWASSDASNTEAQRAAGDALQADVRAQVDSLETEVAKSDNLEGLKTHLRQRLEKIAQRIRSFRDKEEERIRSVEAKNAALTGEIATLRSQADVLDKKLQQQEALLLLDTLTQVHSRFAFDRQIAEEIAAFDRSRTPLCYSIWDIDHFKNVNDTHGHQVGDEILRQVAGYLSRYTRAKDFVARIGGEEFVILLPGTTPDDGFRIAEKLRALIASATFEVENNEHTISLSCGLTELRKDDTPESVYQRADKALYAAKNAGRNRCIAA